MEVVWSDRAIEDLRSADDWYMTNAGAVVRDKFRENIDTCINFISLNPQAARQVFEVKTYELREYVMQKYPYIIAYMVKLENITIVAFLHQSRHIEY
ncbi:MAG: type II toxin-antitoxin system RelE/ParE family toxin [Alphaproteobacteria bacterium]|jgi:plasmid stabilization system protein ParE|nr:type II toxin-antitoxin system RelE/ParE family toxin [Alphaproteobacteria bacterium]